MKNTGQVVRDLARVLVGQKKETVIDVTEESKPVLEAFLSDVYRKYNTKQARPRVRTRARTIKLKKGRRTGPQIALRTS